MKKEKIWDLILIISLIILNMIVKTAYLDYSQIDLDEPYTLYYAQGSLKSLFLMLQWDNNPPLFFIIMHFWVKLFGIGVISARFLPMLFSSLAVAFIYFIGKKFYNKIVAIGASLLYTFSILNIAESHDARVYSLFVLLTAASMFFYFSMIDAEKKRKYLIALTITNILMIYSHLLAFFIIFLQVLYTLFITQIRKKIFKEHLVSMLILFLSYIPYLYILVIRVLSAVGGKMTQFIPKPVISDFYKYLWPFSNNYPNNTIKFLIILFFFILGTILARKKWYLYDIMIMGWFIVPYLLMIFISYSFPIASPKYMIYITPSFYMIIIIAAYYLSNIKTIGILLTVYCIYLMIKTTDLKTSINLGVTDAISTLLEHRTDSTGVYIAPAYISLVFSYHYNQEIFKDFWNLNERLKKDHINAITTANDIDTTNFAKVSDVLLLEGWNGLSWTDPDKAIDKIFTNKFGRADTIGKFKSYTVYHYGTKASATGLNMRPTQQYKNQ